MHHEVLNSKNDLFIFDSIQEVNEFSDGDLFARWNCGERFIGRNLNSWSQVVAAQNKEWHAGLQVLEEFVRRLESIELPEIKDRKRRTHFHDHDGDEVDYDRLHAGQPFWRLSEREDREGQQTMTIITDLTTSANIDSKNVLWRGAAAIATTQVLEAKGYQVELWVVEGSRMFVDRQYPQACITATCLKRTSDALDRSTLVNAVSGWSYRTTYFTLKDSIGKHLGRRVRSSLGNCYTPTAVELDAVSKDEHRMVISEVWSFNAACRLIQEELRRIVEHA